MAPKKSSKSNEEAKKSQEANDLREYESEKDLIGEQSSDGHSAMTDATGGTGSEKDATNGNGTPSGSQESVKSSATVETPEALGLTPCANGITSATAAQLKPYLEAALPTVDRDGLEQILVKADSMGSFLWNTSFLEVGSASTGYGFSNGADGDIRLRDSDQAPVEAAVIGLCLTSNLSTSKPRSGANSYDLKIIASDGMGGNGKHATKNSTRVAEWVTLAGKNSEFAGKATQLSWSTTPMDVEEGNGKTFVGTFKHGLLMQDWKWRQLPGEKQEVINEATARQLAETQALRDFRAEALRKDPGKPFFLDAFPRVVMKLASGGITDTIKGVTLRPYHVQEGHIVSVTFGVRAYSTNNSNPKNSNVNMVLEPSFIKILGLAAPSARSALQGKEFEGESLGSQGHAAPSMEESPAAKKAKKEIEEEL